MKHEVTFIGAEHEPLCIWHIEGCTKGHVESLIYKVVQEYLKTTDIQEVKIKSF